MDNLHEVKNGRVVAKTLPCDLCGQEFDHVTQLSSESPRFVRMACDKCMGENINLVKYSLFTRFAGQEV